MRLAPNWRGSTLFVRLSRHRCRHQNVEPGFDGGMLVGKRYADDQVGIELCTKARDGALSLGVSILSW